MITRLAIIGPDDKPQARIRVEVLAGPTDLGFFLCRRLDTGATVHVHWQKLRENWEAIKGNGK